MQLEGAPRGVSRQGELFDSLKEYLNNKNRLQPIVGLGSIIECVKVGARTREVLYLCEVCVCRLSKADMRNHIMGTLHRYNYIKARHPHLVSTWKENSDLSKLAWPLMELAKAIEGREGAGDVQLIEVEDTIYQRMERHRENDAVTLINSLRDWKGRGEPESHSETRHMQLKQYPTQSHRIVLHGQNQQRTSTQANEPPCPIRPTAVPPNNILPSQLDNTQMSPEPFIPSENNSFLDGYRGTRPLIGLSRVVECRSEDGRTYIFLCHCCRIRANKKNIIDHLTSSSHLINNLMETHPEQMEMMRADVKDNVQFLQSLARKVEQEEGRGELKVINVPESLCIALSGKSYHWCIKMLCNGWKHNSTQKNKTTVKGLSMNKTSAEGMPEKRVLVLPKRAKRTKTRRNMRRVANTVFKVSLPVTKGSVLLERTSFSEDTLPMSYSRSPASDITPSPESQAEDTEYDCYFRSFAVNHTETSMCTTLQLQQDLYGHAGTAQYTGPQGNLVVTQYQEVDGYLSDDENFIQSEDITGTKEQRDCGEWNYNRQCGSRERSSKNFIEELKNDGPQKHSEGLSSAVSHTQDWSSYNSSYSHEQDYTVQWYGSDPQSLAGTRVEVSSEERPERPHAAQYYYQQQPQNQYMALTGSVGHHGFCGELTPHLDAASVNMYPHSGGFPAHSVSVAVPPGVPFHDMQSYTECSTSHVQATLQSYMRQVAAYHTFQTGHGGMANPNYIMGPMTNLEQHCPHPHSSSGDGGVISQSNATITPVQALCYGTYSDHSGTQSCQAW